MEKDAIEALLAGFERVVKNINDTFCQRVDKQDDRLRQLEVAQAVNKTAADEKFITIFKTLEKIDKNSTWILRLVIGAIVVALLSLIIKSGGA